MCTTNIFHIPIYTYIYVHTSHILTSFHIPSTAYTNARKPYRNVTSNDVNHKSDKCTPPDTLHVKVLEILFTGICTSLHNAGNIRLLTQACF